MCKDGGGKLGHCHAVSCIIRTKNTISLTATEVYVRHVIEVYPCLSIDASWGLESVAEKPFHHLSFFFGASRIISGASIVQAQTLIPPTLSHADADVDANTRLRSIAVPSCILYISP